MAADARAERRRQQRAAAKSKPAAGKKPTRKPKAPPAAAPDQPQIEVDGAVVLLVKRDGPNTIVDLQLQGDVRSTEVEKICEYGGKRARDLFG